MCLRHKDSFKTVRDIDELKLQSARSTFFRREKKIERIDIWAPIYNNFPWKKTFPRNNTNEIPHHRYETTQKTKIYTTKVNSK